MATITYSNTTFNVVYVDPSIATAGDGSTPATALSNLPAASSLANNTAYIIRRTAESSYCSVPSGTNSSVQNILFIGMPLSTDAIYSLMPAEAKTAWDADTDTRANIIASSGSTYLQLSNTGYMVTLFHRLNIMWATSVTYLSSGSIFRVGPSSSISIIQNVCTIEYCRFAHQGYPFDDATYVGTSDYNKGCMTGYIEVRGAASTSICHCVINKVTDSNYYCPAGIYLYNCGTLNVEDVDVNLVSTSSTGGNARDAAISCSAYSAPGNVAYVDMHNVRVKYIIDYTASSASSVWYFSNLFKIIGNSNIETLRVSDITATMTNPRSRTIVACASGGSLVDTMSTESSYTTALRNFTVKNITATLPYIPAPANFLRIYRNYLGTMAIGFESSVSDIDLTFGTSCADSVFLESGYAVYLYGGSPGDYSSYCTPCVPTAKNITIKNQHGWSLYAKSYRITDTELEGGTELSGCLADITSIYNWRPDYKSLIVGYYTTVKVGTITVNKNNSLYPYTGQTCTRSHIDYPTSSENYQYMGNIYVETSNAPLCGNVTATSNAGENKYAVTCANNGETGHYTMRTFNYVADTWNVYRTGGAAACLKFWNNSYDASKYPIAIGHRPFKGKCITPTVTGKHTLVVHCAFKGFSSMSDLNKYFWITADRNETGSSILHYDSRVQGQWLDDSSAVWNNDSDLTQLRLEMPIDIDVIAAVDIRVFFSWYNANGFVYLDPAIELTAPSA